MTPLLAIAATTAEQITAWATVGLGAGTLLLAGVALWQAKLTRQALNVAQQDTREASRSRIDQRSPHVTFTAEASAECAAAWLVELQPPATFPVPEQGGAEVALTGWFRCSNEGASTAIVRVPAGVMAFHPEYPIQNLSALRANRYARPAGNAFSLRPGEGRLLFADVRHPIIEWVQFHESGQREHRIHVVVEYTFADGIRDGTDLILIGEPLEPVSDGWRATGRFSELKVARTVREYQRPEIDPS